MPLLWWQLSQSQKRTCNLSQRAEFDVSLVVEECRRLVEVTPLGGLFFSVLPRPFCSTNVQDGS